MTPRPSLVQVITVMHTLGLDLARISAYNWHLKTK